jgi:hypothetical protein
MSHYDSSTTTPIDMPIRTLYYMNKYRSLYNDAEYPLQEDP